MRTFSIKAYAGVRNDVPLERFARADLAAAVNVDIDETGKVSRRKGARGIIAGSDVHSLVAVGQRAFFVDGSNLKEINSNLSATALRSGLSVSRRMAYQGINDDIVFTNGAESGVIRGSTVHELGIRVPPPLNASSIAGALAAGTYGFTMTYVRDDGTESGAPRSTHAEVAQNGGLAITLPISTDPHVVSKRLYVTTANGQEPYFVGSYPNGQTTASYVQDFASSVLCSTQFRIPMPAGQALGFYNGRLYVAEGNVIWYSEPYNYELCDPRTNYLVESARVTIIAPVADGMFVGSETSTAFYSGKDPSEFEREQVSPAGSIIGTLAYADPKFVTDKGINGKVPMWVTTHGVCAGSSGGTFLEMTADRFSLPDATSGAALYRRESGTSHFLAALNQ